MEKIEKIEKIIAEIKSLKIQGAINIALAGLEAIFLVDKKDKEVLLNYQQKIMDARPTEPALRNLVNLYLLKIEKEKSKNEKEIYNKLKVMVLESEEKIIQFGANLINNGEKIYTHCHSSTVEKILKKAFDQGKIFTVFNTETRPCYQGRITAKNLADYGIKVIHGVDSVAHYFIEKADYIFLGMDAISCDGFVYNKVGTLPAVLIAEQLRKKIYFCGHSLKIDLQTKKGLEEIIEERNKEEVWDFNHPNLKIFNPAFDQIDKKYCTGVISEMGVLSPEFFLDKWLRKWEK